MQDNYEDQKGWRARLERERRNLSASVEAALGDRRAHTHSERGDESHGQAGIPETAGGTALIPPRLSLQSRILSAVRPGGFVEAATSARMTVAGNTVTRSTQIFADMQDLHQMALFAQQLTSDFANYGYDPTLVTTHPMEPVARSTYARIPATKPTQRQPMRSATSYSALEGYGIVPAPFPTSAPSQRMSAAPGGAPQRLGGRATRIRLEVPPREQLAARAQEQMTDPRRAELHNTGWQTQEQPQSQQGQGSAQEAPTRTSAHLPALDLFRKGATGTTSARMPVIDIVKGQLEASRRGLSGLGVFECGQSDLIVTNKHITAASVVQVMLTGNPGPVVVHYITLQPRIGFTVHLTAPTNARTPFNYVILP